MDEVLAFCWKQVCFHCLTIVGVLRPRCTLSMNARDEGEKIWPVTMQSRNQLNNAEQAKTLTY